MPSEATGQSSGRSVVDMWHRDLLNPVRDIGSGTTLFAVARLVPGGRDFGVKKVALLSPTNFVHAPQHPMLEVLGGRAAC